jgi:hypothetical protein
VLRSYIRFIPACSRIEQFARPQCLREPTACSLHEPYRNALTANCTSRQPSLPVAAIHSAVFNFAPAQGVVDQQRPYPLPHQRPTQTATYHLEMDTLQTPNYTEENTRVDPVASQKTHGLYTQIASSAPQAEV